MAHPVTLHSLPLFVRLAGRPVILLGEGEAADAKRRLLERAGAVIVGEDTQAALAIVAIDDEAEAVAAVARLKARGVLVNAVDRSALCDFTVPAIVDRAPVLIAIGTGGVSAGLAAALRQRLEALLPAGLGALATALQDARGLLRERYPNAGERRRAIADALREDGSLDPLRYESRSLPPPFSRESGSPGPRTLPPVAPGLPLSRENEEELVGIRLASADPDDLTLRQARALAAADRVYHRPDVPSAILDRARADAARIVCTVAPVEPGTGLSVDLEMRA
jgi:uroporphyrin-III C-methyltransferase/precorrin-2 dehydrogenase/sirohydrochlorin ferrochelatase